MSIRPVYSTMGQQSPASVADDAGRTGGYKYRGDPDWVPGACREPQGPPLPQNKTASAEKRRRFAEYTRLRLEGVPKDEAGRRVGIKASTVSYYEREFQDQQRGGTP